MLPYLWLSLAILSLWLPPQSRAEGGVWRLWLSASWLVVAAAHGYAEGRLGPAALPVIAVLGLLCYHATRADRVTGAARDDGPAGSVAPSIETIATGATLVLSLALMAHVVPGFSNLLVVRDAVLSPGAAPFTLYLNFDKPLVGLFLLAFGPRLLSSPAAWAGMLMEMLPRLLLVIAVVMAIAMASGQVGVDPKWPEVFPIWAWSNLVFTCTSEEALFRGVIQRRLHRWLATSGGQRGDVAAVASAGALFGAAHFAGGAGAVLLATLAGTGYGWIYWRTGRIEASIAAHFLTNVAHMLFFTYPARA